MTNRRARFVLLVALGLVAITSLRASAAEQLANIVRGIALTALRQPIGDHVVRLRSLDGIRPVRTGRTNSTGAYEFNAVDPGVYYVEIVDRANRIVSTDGPIRVASNTSQRRRAVRVAVAGAAAGSIGALTMSALRPGTVVPESTNGQAPSGTAMEVVNAATNAGITDARIRGFRPLPSGF